MTINFKTFRELLLELMSQKYLREVNSSLEPIRKLLHPRPPFQQMQKLLHVFLISEKKTLLL